MPGSLTIWGASQLLTTFFTQTTGAPGQFYLALIRGIAPTPYLSATELDEPDNADYARVAISNDLANWVNDSQPHEIYNTTQITFTTAISDWGEISYWALCNSQVDGYPYLVGGLETPVLISTGDQAIFAAGDLSVSLGPFFASEEE